MQNAQTHRQPQNAKVEMMTWSALTLPQLAEISMTQKKIQNVQAMQEM
jgi:hypothetical protein